MKPKGSFGFPTQRTTTCCARIKSKRCNAPIKTTFLMCYTHWMSLPSEIRDRINRYYRPGRPLVDQHEEYRVAIRHAFEHLNR